MSKLSFAIAIALMSAVLMTTPIGFQIKDAAAQMSRADMAAMEAATAKINAAVQKVQRDKAFIDAVKSRNATKVMVILIKNGAPDSIDDVIFDGPKSPAQQIEVSVSGLCCPVVTLITITY